MSRDRHWALWCLLVAALFVLVVPAQAFVPVLIVTGLILAGGLSSVWLVVFDRHALEAQPEGRRV